MSLYINTAFGPPYRKVNRLATALEPNYLFGERDTKVEPFLYQITAVQLTGDVATATVTIKSGGGGRNTLPAVGATMGVQGTKTSAGLFNVDPTVVTATTVSNATGTGTISYAVTGANVALTADSGNLVVQSAEVPDLVVAGSSSAPFSLVFTPDESDNSRSLFAEAVWSGTLPTTATVVLQVANVDHDSRYVTVGNAQGCSAVGVIASSDAIATVAGSAVTQSAALYNFIMGKFIRAKVLALTGGDDTTALTVTLFS
jgi:hypothetical protein